MNTSHNLDGIVLHRVRFANAIDGLANPFPGPKDALAWRFYRFHK